VRDDYCVYEHWRPDKGECFYVGKGTRRRATTIKRPDNPVHCRILAKLRGLGVDPEIRIFLSGLREDTAFLLEKIRIAYWRSVGSGLANITDGGDGASGLKRTEQTKLKQSASAAIRGQNPEYRKAISEIMKKKWADPDFRASQVRAIKDAPRKPASEEAKNNRLLALRAHFASKPKKPKPEKKQRVVKEKKAKRSRSEFIEQLREFGYANKHIFAQYSHMGPRALARSVVCVSDGRIFDSASAAARYYGVARSALIELCLGQKNRKSVGGLLFSYEDAT